MPNVEKNSTTGIHPVICERILRKFSHGGVYRDSLGGSGGFGVGSDANVSSSWGFGRSVGSSDGSLRSLVLGLCFGGSAGSRLSDRLDCLLGLGCLGGRGLSARSRNRSRSAGGGSGGSGCGVNLGCLGGSASGFALLWFLVLLLKDGLELRLQVGKCVRRNSTHCVSCNESTWDGSRKIFPGKGYEVRKGTRRESTRVTQAVVVCGQDGGCVVIKLEE
ncbi:hypothetical protein F5B21DRAFT_488939 [Xylaria acuta]|nr:hypothetical protein F5B21DRAFT_488939 [Xylaria acuta]